MAKLKKIPRRVDEEAAEERLRAGLKKLKKDELIDLLVKCVNAEPNVMPTLEEFVELGDPPYDELLQITRIAIDKATYFNPRDINSNFDYDSAAYDMVKKNFSKLIKLGGSSDVMVLAVELMRAGSFQASRSDEAEMLDEIVDCVGVATAAVKKANLDPDVRRAWVAKLLNADRSGFIFPPGLESLGK